MQLLIIECFHFVGLIKHGCNTGSITITLANVGSNAFKPTEYGQEIRILRNITSGSSTYRIFNQFGNYNFILFHISRSSHY